MSCQIAYLNHYGNAEVLAQAIERFLDKRVKTVDLSLESISDDADTYLICFELTRGAVPLEIMDVLEELEGTRIALFVTGDANAAENTEIIDRKVRPFLPDDCNYCGLFACPGQLPADIQEQIEQMAMQQPDNEQAAVMARSCRAAAGHPDREDLTALQSFLAGILN